METHGCPAYRKSEREGEKDTHTHTQTHTHGSGCSLCIESNVIGARRSELDAVQLAPAKDACRKGIAG